MLVYIPDPVEGMDGLRPFEGSAIKITIHTTETDVKPNWQVQRKGLPHYTLDGNKVYEHIPLDMAAYTLLGGDYSPNSDAGVNIQIEWVGWAKDSQTRSDEDYAALAELIHDICQKTGCIFEFPFPFAGSDGYGLDGTVRQDWANFAAANGIVGHSHAPYNKHWDPGLLDVERLKKFYPKPSDCNYDDVVALLEKNHAEVLLVLAGINARTITMLSDISAINSKVEALSEQMQNLRFIVEPE
jgi:hypothetical protein